MNDPYDRDDNKDIFWDQSFWIDHRYNCFEQVDEKYYQYLLEFDCPRDCLYCGEQIGQWLKASYVSHSDVEIELPVGNSYYILLKKVGRIVSLHEHCCEDCMELLHFLNKVSYSEKLLPHEVDAFYRDFSMKQVEDMEDRHDLVRRSVEAYEAAIAEED